MLRLQEEVESKDDVTNRLRNAEEEMEVHIANIERLEKLLKEKENERLHSEERDLEDRNAETKHDIEELLKEKEKLQNVVESLKTKSEEMEKTYEKEKQQLCDTIAELQNQVKESEKKDSEFRLHLSEDSYSGLSTEREDALPEEKPATPQTDNLKAKIESLEEEFKNKENENIQLKEGQEELSDELSRLNKNKVELEKELQEKSDELREKNDEFTNLKQGYEQEIERLRATKHEIHGNEELLKENESLKKDVGILKTNVKTLTSDLQDVTNEKGEVQNAFQEAEIAWEDEKNNLQQQLYDSFLEASSFKVSETTYSMNIFKIFLIRTNAAKFSLNGTTRFHVWKDLCSKR
jgi:predicted  nucleic acid-binding Zn-ribbon protein